MAFGKKKRRQSELEFDNFHDASVYENQQISSSEDEDTEEVQIIDDREKHSNAEGGSQSSRSIQSGTSKPLFDEIKSLGSSCGKNPGGAKQWECKHCKATFKSSYTRIHAHFFGPGVGKKSDIKRCPALMSNPSELDRVRKKVQEAEKCGNVSSSLKSSKLLHRQSSKGKNPLEESFALMDRHVVDVSIVTALCANGIPFNVLRNPQFCKMVMDINEAPKGYKAPSYEKSRTTLLDEVKTNVDRELIPVRETWFIDGLSIVSDGWGNVKKNPLINIIAVNSRAGMFLYAVDSSGIEKTGTYIAELLLKAIEEVGPSNVLQVVTDNASNCKLAGKEVEKVYPHIFWSPCVVHTLNLVLKDLAKEFYWFHDIYSKGKEIVKFFINHNQVLTTFRIHSNLELLKVAKTRFGSHYIMLKRLVDVKEALATTVVLNSWKELLKNIDTTNREKGTKVAGYIGDDEFWDDVNAILAIIKPIYRLIRFCDKDGPIMGEIYEAMDNMLGEVKDILKRNKYKDSYEGIEAIILSRWEKMNVHMYCLGFALSPRFYDLAYINTPASGGTTRKRPNEDKEVMAGVLKAFEKIASDPDEGKLLRRQFADFHMKKGLFSTVEAFADAATMDAIEWWATYGSETPELAEVARKVLAQPITSSSAERNWSTYSYIHNIKRNRLNSSRADKLVFIHSNIRMLSRFHENYKDGLYKKWDVNPEDTVVDDSHLRLEEMRWQSLDDKIDDIEEKSKEQGSQESQSQAPRMRYHNEAIISKFARKDGGGPSKDKGNKKIN